MTLFKKKCPCCKKSFYPSPRSANRQIYCNEPECRSASKKASQKKWLDNNPCYFSGITNVERVRQWRLANPGYSRRKGSCSVSCDALQDDLKPIPLVKQPVADILLRQNQPLSLPNHPLAPALQDFDIMQHPVLVGLIAHFTGYALQDEIGQVAHRLQKLGLDVISAKGVHHDPQTSNLPRPYSIRSQTVQLGVVSYIILLSNDVLLPNYLNK